MSDIKLRETHVSLVILTGEYAYKIKKRVKLEFLDTTTLTRRHFLCDEELRLNKRFAPDVYLEVAPITQDDSGIRLGRTGAVIDYAVKMKQFDPSQELPALLLRAAFPRIPFAFPKGYLSFASDDNCTGETHGHS